jgi:nitrogen fixation/metabolism regulation signal transduction histidine kinase
MARPPAQRTSARKPGSAPALPAAAVQAAELVIAATPPAEARRTVTGLLLRFISCGILALAFGVAWRLTLAPPIVGPASAFAGIFFLLLGFIAGGVLWYLRDARRRRRDPESLSDERLVFSFIVFAVMPFAVLVLVGLVWLLALLVGAG